MPPDAETVSVAEAPRVTLDGVAEKLEMIGPPLEGSTVREVVVVALRAALSFTKTRTVKVVDSPTCELRDPSEPLSAHA